MAHAPTKQPRIISQAAELAASERYCTCCERPLRSKVAWLEFDQRTNAYHDCGGVPVESSQGWFPFGMTCARAVLAKHAPEKEPQS